MVDGRETFGVEDTPHNSLTVLLSSSLSVSPCRRAQLAQSRFFTLYHKTNLHYSLNPPSPPHSLYFLSLSLSFSNFPTRLGEIDNGSSKSITSHPQFSPVSLKLHLNPENENKNKIKKKYNLKNNHFLSKITTHHNYLLCKASGHPEFVMFIMCNPKLANRPRE